MAVYYRKNDVWTTVYINIKIEDLGNLGTLVEEAVFKQQNIKQKSRKWQAIDIVDTEIIGKSFNSHRNETMIELLVYVADLTGKQL